MNRDLCEKVFGVDPGRYLETRIGMWEAKKAIGGFPTYSQTSHLYPGLHGRDSQLHNPSEKVRGLGKELSRCPANNHCPCIQSYRH